MAHSCVPQLRTKPLCEIGLDWRKNTADKVPLKGQLGPNGLGAMSHRKTYPQALAAGVQ